MTARARALSVGLGLLGGILFSGALVPSGGCGGGRPAASTTAEEERIAVRVADEVIERMEREGLLDPDCECRGADTRDGE